MSEALKAVANTLFGTGDTTGVIPTVFTWITSATVLPYFAIGIACSLALFGVKVIRGIVWGA